MSDLLLHNELPDNHENTKNNHTSSRLPIKRKLVFLAITAGNLTHWIWLAGWAYVADPNTALFTGPILAIVVRALLSMCAAALTLNSICSRLENVTEDPDLCYFLAFQQGFFFQAAFDAVAHNDH